jgi:hypothetical protein
MSRKFIPFSAKDILPVALFAELGYHKAVLRRTL